VYVCCVVLGIEETRDLQKALCAYKVTVGGVRASMYKNILGIISWLCL
jgi:hypothetical protein